MSIADDMCRIGILRRFAREYEQYFATREAKLIVAGNVKNVFGAHGPMPISVSNYQALVSMNGIEGEHEIAGVMLTGLTTGGLCGSLVGNCKVLNDKCFEKGSCLAAFWCASGQLFRSLFDSSRVALQVGNTSMHSVRGG
jgi:hypothetical protein